MPTELMGAIRIKPDKVLRDRFFTPESYQHPAKGHLGLWWEILERYTKPGDWVLDPMAGVGATMLGTLMGRNVICVELEQHFITPLRASWAKMRQSPMLGHTLGQVVILRGDARALPLGKADAVVTSPPYEGVADSTKNTNTNDAARGYPTKPMAYTRPAVVDAVITSPPYEGNLQSTDRDFLDRLDKEGAYPQSRSDTSLNNRSSSYTRPQVDAVVTSPPYEESVHGGHGLTAEGFRDPQRVGRNSQSLQEGYTCPVDSIITSPPYESALDGTGAASP